MSRRRFIADSVSAGRAVLVGAHAAHLSRVLRARPGQEFDIAVNGRVRRGRIVRIEEGRVEFELGEDVPAEAAAPVTLYLAVFKFDRMEWAIEKCTELGVARIVPIIAGRTSAHLAAASENRATRWRRLALQAAEQSRRDAPPVVATPVKLVPGVLAVEGTRIVLAESELHSSLKDVLGQPRGAAAPVESRPSSAVALAVGPEGGWTDAELNLFSASGWTPASLGRMILRAETAAIAALAIVMAEVQ